MSPRRSMMGQPRSADSRSANGKLERSGDRSRAIGRGAGMAGGIHRQPAAGAVGPAGGQDLFGLTDERSGLGDAEPELGGRRLVLERLLGDHDEAVLGLVVAHAQLTGVPNRLEGCVLTGAGARSCVLEL